MKDVYKEIISFISCQKNERKVEFLKTREIADAIGLTIYQTRSCLEVLCSLGIVEKINTGKGVSGVWGLR